LIPAVRWKKTAGSLIHLNRGGRVAAFATLTAARGGGDDDTESRSWRR
jgi:hypothetical protein